MKNEAVDKLVVRFRDVPNMQFFRVVSDESPELKDSIFVCVPDEKLPEKLRADDNTEVLFIVSSIDPVQGGPTEVEVESVPFDTEISETALVQFYPPVDRSLLHNGARVFIWSDRVPSDDFPYLGRIVQSDMLDITPARHSPNRYARRHE